MRILFIECDGVLHPLSATVRFTPCIPLKHAVQNAWLFRWAWILDDLLARHPDVGIVIHSHWRDLAPADELQGLLGPLAARYAGTTAHGHRWEGISQVIQQNELRDFRILDPYPQAFPDNLPQLIACDPEVGLQAFSIRKQILNWVRTPQILSA